MPLTGLAESAGLEVDNGVVTDEHLRTSHPDVRAAGDIAGARHPVLGRHVRVEHWDNAVAQGTTAAHNMLDADAIDGLRALVAADEVDRSALADPAVPLGDVVR